MSDDPSPAPRPGAIPLAMLESYSAGALTRREIAQALGREVPFGDLMLELLEAGLPLPRPPVDRSSPGMVLLHTLLTREAG